MNLKLTSLIPAGGEGTRLLPHTLFQQKPMLLMGDSGKKIIDFSIELSKGCEKIFVTTNKSVEKSIIVEKYLSENSKINILRDKRTIGAGSLIDFYDVFSKLDPNGDIVVLPSDLVYRDISIQSFYEQHKDNNSDITLLVTSPKKYGEYISINNTGYADKVFLNVRPNCQSTTGIYIFKNRYIVNWMRNQLKNKWNGEPKSMYHDIVCPAIYNDKVGIYKISDKSYWDDTGTLDRYYSNNMIFSSEENVISDKAQINPKANIKKSIILGSPTLGEKTVLNGVILSGVKDDIKITQILK